VTLEFLSTCNTLAFMTLSNTAVRTGSSLQMSWLRLKRFHVEYLRLYLSIGWSTLLNYGRSLGRKS